MNFFKVFTFVIFTLLVGCSVTTVEKDTPVIEVVNKDYGEHIFFNDFEEVIKNKNTLNQNIVLLKSIDNNKKLILQIKNNRKVNDPYYHYYYNYIMLQHEVITKIKENKRIKEKRNKLNDEIAFLLNACKKSKLDIANDLHNLAKENPMHFKNLSQENQDLVNKCLDKKIKEEAEAEIRNKEAEEAKIKEKKAKESKAKEAEEMKRKIALEKEIKAKKDIQLNSYKESFKNKRKMLDKHFLIIQSHCNEEDSYLLPEYINQFKSYVTKVSKNNKLLEDYIYSQYSKDVEHCLNIYNSNELLNYKEENKVTKPLPEVKNIDKNNEANIKTLKIIKDMGYSGYNFKEKLTNVSDMIFSTKKNHESLLKTLSGIVRKIDKDDFMTYLEDVEYNNKRYHVFYNNKSNIQIYYPIEKELSYKTNDKLVNRLYYSIFDYGYINDHKTLIMNKVKL